MSRHMLPLWAAPVFGVVAGTLTRLTDLLPQDMWGIASVATLFGFWVVSVVFLVRYSHSCLNAGWNVSSYLLMMSVAFYVGEYLLGQFLPTFDNGDFRWRLLLIYGVASLICGAAAMVLYLWKKDKWYQPILLAGPVGVLLAETIGVFLWYLSQRTYLFQLLFDAVFAVWLGVSFYQKANRKVVYLIAVTGYSLLFYFGVYGMWL